MVSLEAVMFACGLALGIVLATFILVGSQLYQEYRKIKDGYERRPQMKSKTQKHIKCPYCGGVLVDQGTSPKPEAAHKRFKELEREDFQKEYTCIKCFRNVAFSVKDRTLFISD